MPSIQARYWLLTIPQHEFVPYLPVGIEYIKGQLEQGENTNYLHWQVIAYCKKKCSLFGIKKVFGESAHCEVSRSDAAEAYVWKDETAVPNTRFELGSKKEVGNKRTLEEALNLAGDDDEGKFLVACVEAGLSYQYAKRFRELHYQDNSSTLLDWDGKGTMNLQLLATELVEGKSTVLIGPSGIGKTTWAKKNAPKPCLFVSHLDVLRKFRAGYHKSIIFDDMKFTHFPVQSQIHLVDWQDVRQIHCRYGCATIPANTTKVFLCNEVVFTDHPAIERRVISIIIN
jgi:hypothetical protein